MFELILKVHIANQCFYVKKVQLCKLALISYEFIHSDANSTWTLAITFGLTSVYWWYMLTNYLPAISVWISYEQYAPRGMQRIPMSNFLVLSIVCVPVCPPSGLLTSDYTLSACCCTISEWH